MALSRVVRASGLIPQKAEKFDILEPGNMGIGYGAAVDRTGKLSGKVEMNQNDISAYKQYHDEIEAERLRKPESQKPEPQKAEPVGNKKAAVEETPAPREPVTQEPDSIGGSLSGNKSKSSFSAGKLLGAVGLTGAAATAGILGTTYFLNSEGDPGNQNGGDPSIFDRIKELITGLAGGGGSYIIEGSDPGEPGHTSVVTEAAETLSGYAPLIIGALLVIGIIYLVTKKKTVGKTTRSNRA